MQHNLYMEEELFNLSTQVSIYPEKYGLFDLLCSLTKGVGFYGNDFSSFSYIATKPRI